VSEKSQFALLGQRRFLPYFLVQFTGALNDNVYKNALVMLIAFGAASGESETLLNVAAALFILPFFLFSATAGQIAEKYEKAHLIRLIKAGEIVIMALVPIGLWLGSQSFLIAILFLLGAQSAFFGPVKYSLLPQVLREEELIGGNGLVESGTFLAILIGTIGGGLLALTAGHVVWISVVVIIVAVAGFLASLAMPPAPAAAPDLQIDWNVLRTTFRGMELASEVRSVHLSILGISWFWAFGAAYLSHFPIYARETLGGSETVVTVLLVCFSVGIGVGSALCEKLSGKTVELGLVPFGSIGLSIFGIDLFLADHQPWTGGELRDWLAFVSDPASWRVIADLFLIGLFAGFYIVPLYAIIQTRTEPAKRGRVIAANNIQNALFMVLSAGLSIFLLGTAEFTVPQMFLIFAGINIAVALYIYSLVPEFLMRFLVWLLVSAVYRVEKRGLELIPEEGPAVVVANHVSFVDALVLAGSVRRPVRFVMDHQIFQTPVLGFIFRTAGAVPVAPRKENPEIYEAAFGRVAQYLRRGELVCIFPEGMLTRTGEMNEFRPGLMRILQETPVPVIPVGLSGLWDSIFSRAKGGLVGRAFRELRRRVGLVVGPAVAPEAVELPALAETVRALRGERL
jgi:1-acyl-sn-glycerol-3-phosphate acyltransferase